MMNQARFFARKAANFLRFEDKIIAMDAAHDDIAALCSALEKAQARATAAGNLTEMQSVSSMHLAEPLGYLDNQHRIPLLPQIHSTLTPASTSTTSA